MLVPLAVGGTTAIGAIVGGALLLMLALMRAETRDEAEGDPQERPRELAARRRQPFSSESLVRARSSAGSFSRARSIICMALGRSPCLALISPR